MSEALFETLAELMALPAPTGQEEPVLAWCRERWARAGAEVTVQPVGNVLARVPGNGPKLIIQGHADEISFLVKSIDERGFLFLADGQAGSRQPQNRFPAGQEALVLGRDGARIPGLFATATGHILVTLPGKNTLEANDLFVDVGVESREEAEALGVHVGAGVIWNPPVRRLGARYVSKAIDDRVALALATHLIEEVAASDLHYDLTVATTVQEEIGLVGATSLTRGAYDLAIAIDNGPLGDYPGIDPRELPIRLGHGPTLSYKDGSAHYDRRIIKRLREVAIANQIPFQEAVIQGMGTDGAAMIRSGVPTAQLMIGTRYTHSPFEMGDVRDLESTLALLKAFVTTPAEPLPMGPE
ncbi:MAG: M20/M25/M40 family metallo-hydrolase [Thermomicrobiales bacterium]|nr:M20/M25/M40 family metallo-hydrolase [Thermomicrobiales bacterium]